MAEGKPKRSPFLPVIGLVIAIVLGVVGWVAAPSITAALPIFSGTGLPFSTIRIIVTVIFILIGLVMFGLVAALLAPKDSQRASERTLEQERDALRRRQKAERAEALKSKNRR